MAEEEYNTDFAAERFLGAIIKNERKMFHIFGVKEQERRTTDWTSATTRGKRIYKDKNQSNFSKSGTKMNGYL